MRRYTVNVGGTEYHITVETLADDRFRVAVEGDEFEGDEFEVQLQPDDEVEPAPGTTRHIAHDTPAQPAAESSVRQPDSDEERSTPSSPEAESPQPESSHRIASLQPYPLCEATEYSELTAPMPGTILSVEIAPGEPVQCGQVVAILEAMKMKNALQAPQDGVVNEVRTYAGASVDMGDVLMTFSAHTQSEKR
jgi:biotin carboxyl carrier protein